MKKVWIILDDDNTPLSIFSNKKAANYSAAHDKFFYDAGYSATVVEFSVYTSPTVPYRKSKKKRKAK